jgi:putative ABC transport system permease protein
MLSQPVSDMLLAGQVQSATSSTNPYVANVQPLDKVDVSVNGITALEIFGISILLASVAGVVSIGKITKYEPIKILMERN